MGIIAKLLPLERVIGIAQKLGFLTAPIKLLAQAWVKAKGHRTQVLVVLAGLVAGAASFGIIPWEQANKIIDALLILAGPAFLEKWHRVSGGVEKVSAAVEAEANKAP